MTMWTVDPKAYLHADRIDKPIRRWNANVPVYGARQERDYMPWSSQNQHALRYNCGPRSEDTASATRAAVALRGMSRSGRAFHAHSFAMDGAAACGSPARIRPNQTSGSAGRAPPILAQVFPIEQSPRCRVLPNSKEVRPRHLFVTHTNFETKTFSSTGATVEGCSTRDLRQTATSISLRAGAASWTQRNANATLHEPDQRSIPRRTAVS